MMMGRHDEGMAEIERAMELDPLSVRTLSWYAAALRGVGRCDDAIAAARQVLSLESDDGMARNTWWQALVLKGSYDEALAMDKEAFARDPELMER